MKKILIFSMLIFIILASSGCATWGAIKEDTSNAWNSTKKAVHEATE